MADFPDNVFYGSIDDLNNVVNSTIAGIPLKQNEITKEELQKAISTYPVIISDSLPTPSTQDVNNRQMCAVKKTSSDNKFDLYICLGKHINDYRWGHICGDFNPVPKTEDMTQPVGVDENGQLWVAPIGGNGLTTAQVNALDGMFKKCAFTGDVSAEYEAFKEAFGLTEGGNNETPDEPTEPDLPVNPDVTLTSISATYSGGSVAVGTALTSLTGLTVKATYSDSSTKNVTGYTLSGTIAEGSNTITVSYGGKTTTFTVVGVAESGGEDTGDGTEWSDGVPYEYTLVANEYVNLNGFNSYNGWSRTPYLPCKGVSSLVLTFTDSTKTGLGGAYGAWYDADKNMINVFNQSASNLSSVPSEACYFILSQSDELMNSIASITPHA